MKLRHWKAYHSSGRQPHPAKWRIEKCIDFLMANPIPIVRGILILIWLVMEMHEWRKVYKEMIHESQQKEKMTK